MARKLFVPDAPQGLMEESTEIIAGWASAKYQLCRGQILLVCQQLLAQGIPIVLDGAAANKEQRDLIRKKAADSGVDFKLHYVTCDSETRRRRVFERNSQKGKTYSLEATQGIFDLIESFLEAPVGDELAGTRIIET